VVQPGSIRGPVREYLGHEGRNLLNAPGKWNFDLSLHREFRPTEAITLQFRWEAFDFTNTVTPAAPISVLGAPGFGRIVTFTGNRQQQIALKFSSKRISFRTSRTRYA
jgi:hypothetical protein